MGVQLRVAQAEHDAAIARCSDLERQVGFAWEDSASFQEMMLRYRQQLKEAEDELRCPEKKRARISS